MRRSSHKDKPSRRARRSEGRPQAGPIPEVDVVAGKLAQSLRSTCQGLAAFKESLDRSGLKGAVKPYRQMQITLLQQHAWAARNNRAELSALWRELAETAGDIHAIMTDFASIMDVLKHIDGATIRDESRTTPPPESAETTALAAMLAGFSLSPGRTAALGADHIDRLLAAGLFERRGRGARSSLRIGAAAQQELVDCLTRRLANGSKPTSPDGEAA